MPQEQSDKIQKVMQILPDLEIHQYVPILRIPVGLDEPTTMLGKIAVVLNNRIHSDVNHKLKVSVKLIHQMLRDHKWNAEGSTAVIDQLVQWEILVHRSHYLWIQPERFRSVKHEKEIEVK